MKRKSMIFVLTLLAAVLLAGCGCKHEWQDAVCEDPNYVEAVAAFRQTCVNCGEISETTGTLEKLHEDGVFLLSPREFVERLNYIASENGFSYHFRYFDAWEWSGEPVTPEDGEILVNIGDGYKPYVVSVHKQYVEKRSHFTYASFVFCRENLDELAYIMQAACDPTIGSFEEDGATIIAESKKHYDTGVFERNGLEYELGMYPDDTVCINVQVPE